MMHITLAGRGSKLALAQNEIVKRILENAGYEVTTIVVSTRGDRDKTSSVTGLGGDGPFVRDIETALLSGLADAAVHCVKDLPYESAHGLVIAGILDEADARDVLLLRRGVLASLQHGDTVIIGTGSPRRKVQLSRLYANVTCRDIRGNITTRIEKLRNGLYDGIVLAKAGLDRIGADLSDFEIITFTPDEMIPAVGQGLLAIQCRAEDKELREILFRLSPAEAYLRYMAERDIFCRFRMNCRDAVAVNAQIDINALKMNLRILSEAQGAGDVYIVGAGPSSELITVEGLAAIKKAEVIIYDELLDGKLLLMAKDNAVLIPAGKRYKRHSKTQDEINDLLIRCAHTYGTVVRLKGGDPFVFGRGGEEFLALRAAGIEANVIPGVSSAIAAAEVMGIPVTHRGSASSFTVVTGHGANETAEDLSLLARLRGTLVFMMAWHKIREIAEGLIAAGKPPDTPAAILCSACMPGQKRVTDTLGRIADHIDETYPPSVLIVGDVAKFDFSPPKTGRLSGRSYLVTGTRGFAQKMCGMLSVEGAWSTSFHCLEVRKLPDRVPKDFSDTGWLVFTSVNGVKIFFEEISATDTDIRELSHIRYACIGEATAAELAKHHIHADLMPEKYTSATLGKALVDHYDQSDGRIVMLRAAEASTELGAILSGKGIPYEEIAIYSIERPETIPLVPDCHYDAVILASAGGAKAFYDMVRCSDGLEKFCDVPAVCIGENTSAAWKRLTGKDARVAVVSTAQGIIEALV